MFTAHLCSQRICYCRCLKDFISFTFSSRSWQSFWNQHLEDVKSLHSDRKELCTLWWIFWTKHKMIPNNKKIIWRIFSQVKRSSETLHSDLKCLNSRQIFLDINVNASVSCVIHQIPQRLVFVSPKPKPAWSLESCVILGVMSLKGI